MIGAKNFIGSLIDQWLQKLSNCKILSKVSIKSQKETFQERIFKSAQRFLFWMILTLWPKSCPIDPFQIYNVLKLCRVLKVISLYWARGLLLECKKSSDQYCQWNVFLLHILRPILYIFRGTVWFGHQSHGPNPTG